MYKIGNKTLCDICSSKAMKKARVKKEQKETATPSVEGDHLEETTPPPTPPPIEEGITRNTPIQYHIQSYTIKLVLRIGMVF